MTKRSKLMLGVSALLLATAGVAATGTFAWFTATNVEINDDATATGTMVSTTNGAALGSFVITPVIDTASFDDSVNPVGVALTDSKGDTYVMNESDHSQKTKVTAQNTTRYATVPVKLQIDYTGIASTPAEIEALWADAAGTMTFTISETTTYTGSAPSAIIVGALASGQPLNGKTKGTHYGLKFEKDSAPAADGNADSWISNAAYNPASGLAKALTANALDDPGTFGTPSNNGNGTYSSTVTTSAQATFYVGIIGIDNVVQANTDAYAFQIAVANS